MAYSGLTEELEGRAEELGCHLLSCPVFGRPDAVKAGNAFFVCAGDTSAKQKVWHYGHRVFPQVNRTQPANLSSDDLP